MDIRDSIEEKYTNYLNCETDDIDLTVEEAKFILVNDKKVHFVDDLLERAWGIILSELEKKEAIINLMAKQLVEAHGWFYSEFDNFTEKNWIDYFTKKVEGK